MRVFALMLLGACVNPQYITCGDLICPIGSVCLANSQCASPELIAACDGKLDGDACQTATFAGTCVGGVCTIPRCGDGVIEGSEQCDGPVVDVDCADYGYDLGVPGCTSCDLDVIDRCTRFGWQLMLPVPAPRYTKNMWTDGSRVIVDRGAGTPGVDIYVAGQLVASSDGVGPPIAGNAHGAIALMSYNQLMWSVGGAFTPAATIGGIQDLTLAADDTAYVVDTICQVFAVTRGGQPKMIRGAAHSSCHVTATADMGIVVVDYDTTGHVLYITRWTGTSWVPVDMLSTLDTPSSVDARNGVIMIGTNYGFIRWNGGFLVNEVRGAYAVAVTSDAQYAASATSIVRIVGDVEEELDVPGVSGVTTDGTALYAYGSSGVYTFSGIEFADHIRLPSEVTDIAALGDGYVVAALPQFGITQTAGTTSWQGYAIPAALGNFMPTTVTGRALTNVYASDGSLLVHCGNFPCANVAPPGFTGIEDLYATPAGEPSLYAVGGALTMVDTGGAWSTIAPAAPGCALHAIHGNGAIVAAAGECAGTGIVWQLAGATWTEVYRGGGPLLGVAVTSDDDIFACGPNGGARTLGGSWTVEPAAIGTSISATTSGDVFVAGGPKQVIHWDGTVWSRLNASGTFHPRVAASQRAVYFGGVETSVLLR